MAIILRETAKTLELGADNTSIAKKWMKQNYPNYRFTKLLHRSIPIKTTYGVYEFQLRYCAWCKVALKKHNKGNYCDECIIQKKANKEKFPLIKKI